MSAPAAELKRPLWLRRRERLQPEGRVPPSSRTVPSDVGPIRAVADEVFVPWMDQYATWEVEEAELLRRWLSPGDTFIDVGAHVGYFTLLAAERVGRRGRVIAFEPDEANYSTLVANVRSRRYRNVGTVNAALWSTSRDVGLVRSESNSGDHRTRVDGGLQQVTAVALDDAIPPGRVDVIKIDTQGTDHHVIRGAARTIARCRPRLVVEFWPEGIVDVDAAALPGEYRSLGYSLAALQCDIDSDAPGDEFVRAAGAAPHDFLTLVLEPT